MTVDLPGLAKWLADHPAPEKPWNPIAEERMAAAADGRSLRPLPTDPAVRGRGRRDRREGDYVSTDGATWHYEPYSGASA